MRFFISNERTNERTTIKPPQTMPLIASPSPCYPYWLKAACKWSHDAQLSNTNIETNTQRHTNKDRHTTHPHKLTQAQRDKHTEIQKQGATVREIPTDNLITRPIDRHTQTDTHTNNHTHVPTQSHTCSHTRSHKESHRGPVLALNQDEIIPLIVSKCSHTLAVILDTNRCKLVTKMRFSDFEI